MVYTTLLTGGTEIIGIIILEVGEDIDPFVFTYGMKFLRAL